MRTLGAMGIRFAVDDFGTGYSSFSYLRDLPVRQLKIDRVFTSRMTESPDDAAIVGAMCAMAKALGLQAVAEGVERQEEVEALRACGCDQGQGYLFSQAVDGDALLALLEAAPS